MKTTTVGIITGASLNSRVLKTIGVVEALKGAPVQPQQPVMIYFHGL